MITSPRSRRTTPANHTHKRKARLPGPPDRPGIGQHVINISCNMHYAFRRIEHFVFAIYLGSRHLWRFWFEF